MAYLFDPNMQIQDRNGRNNVNGFLRVYLYGTDDRATTYRNFDGTLNSADIRLDNNGRAVVIVDATKAYRLEVYDRHGILLWTQQPLSARGEGRSEYVRSDEVKSLVVTNGEISEVYYPLSPSDKTIHIRKLTVKNPDGTDAGEYDPLGPNNQSITIPGQQDIVRLEYEDLSTSAAKQQLAEQAFEAHNEGKTVIIEKLVGDGVRRELTLKFADYNNGGDLESLVFESQFDTSSVPATAIELELEMGNDYATESTVNFPYPVIPADNVEVFKFTASFMTTTTWMELTTSVRAAITAGHVPVLVVDVGSSKLVELRMASDDGIATTVFTGDFAASESMPTTYKCVLNGEYSYFVGEPWTAGYYVDYSSPNFTAAESAFRAGKTLYTKNANKVYKCVEDVVGSTLKFVTVGFDIDGLNCGYLTLASDDRWSVTSESKVVTTDSSQSLDSTEQANARGNIGAASASDLSSLQSQVSSLSNVSVYVLQGAASVATLNAGPAGIQPGWTYNMTDSGTLTDGSLVVKAGDTVAWDGTVWIMLVDTDYYASKSSVTSLESDVQTKTDSIYTEIGSNIVSSDYSGNKQTNEQLVLGNINSSGVVDDSNHDRRHTNYIGLDTVKLIVGNQSGYEAKAAWFRCFDASKTFVGSSFSGEPTDVAGKTGADILANSPAGTKYVILVYSIAESAAFSYVTVKYRYGAVGNLEERLVDSLNKASVTMGNKNDMALGVTKYSMVQGSVDSSTGELKESTTRQRTDYIDIAYVKEFYRPSSTTTEYWVRCYDTNKNYLGTPSFGSTVEYPNTVLVDDVLAELPKTKFVIIVISSGTSSVWVNSYDYVKVDAELVGRPVGFRQSNQPVIRFKFDLDDGHYSTGRLMLPSSYTANGKPTPVIVFCQGSGDYTEINGPITTHYQTQYQYLCDEGFAVLSIYGWGNVYPTSGVGTWNSKTNRKCWYGGIEYVLKHYNLDRRNLFVSAKSMGGAQALALWYDGIIPVRAAGLLAPALNVEGHRWGYVNGTRHMYAQDMGFSEDTNNVLDDEGTMEQFVAYATENYPKWIGYEPWLKGLLGLTKQEQVEMLSPGLPGPFYNDTSLQRVGPVGSKIKIWSAIDDTNLNKWANALIAELQLTGCTAEMRNLPAGCNDPHHAVDTDPLAEQKTDVTTRLGVEYESIALAYYELAQMFIEELV